MVRALSVVREIRDWADAPSLPGSARLAFERAAALVEQAVDDAQSAHVEPIGPARTPAPSGAPDDGESAPRSTEESLQIQSTPSLAAPEAGAPPSPAPTPMTAPERGLAEPTSTSARALDAPSIAGDARPVGAVSATEPTPSKRALPAAPTFTGVPPPGLVRA
ncbi:hypothetical protein L6R52_41655, partial [Myxococcota bacterium]|nr:hypothetical protein [Myxococcota bacterium]